MVILQMWQDRTEDILDDLRRVGGLLSTRHRAVIQPSLDLQTEALQLPAGFPGPHALDGEGLVSHPLHRYLRFAEVFTNGTDLVVVELRQRQGTAEADPAGGPVRGEDAPAADAPAEHLLTVYAISGTTGSPMAADVVGALRTELGLELAPYSYRSERFDELLHDEAVAPAPRPPHEQLVAARVLTDRAARTIAVAARTSGGLLVSNVPELLRGEAGADPAAVLDSLWEAGILTTETIVVCSVTNAPTARMPSPDLLADLAARGVRCACGRALDEEHVDAVLSITELGALLVESSRWFSVLVAHELVRLGVFERDIVLEQIVGGDAVDCLANIGGELALLEIKDDRFSLGDAYAFGAKIGMVRPRFSLIITTDEVGEDAREHFQEQEATGSAPPRYVERGDYAKGLEQFAGEIYARDAARVIEHALSFAAVDAATVVQEYAGRGAHTAIFDEDFFEPGQS